MKALRWFSTSLATAALLAACGGGGPAAPSILTEPADVSVGEGGTAAFSVAAIGDDPMTYTWRRDGSPNSLGSSVNLSIGPVTLYDSGATFSAVVGNAQGSSTSRSAALTVTPRQWSATPLASGIDSEGSANENAGVTDAQGNFVFAFFGPSATQGRAGIWLGRKTASGTFTASQVSSAVDAPSAAAMELHLAVDSSGAAMAVWRRRDVGLNNASEAYAALVQWGNGPDLPATRVSLPADFAMEPNVAVVGDGLFEVIWTENTIGNPVLRVMTRRFDRTAGSWAAAQTIASISGENVSSPRIAADGAGHVWAAWSQYTQANVYTVYGKERTSGMTAWDNTAATALSVAGRHAPQVRMNANGHGVLSFNDSAGRVYVRRLSSTGWTPPLYVANAYVATPSFALHTDGRIAIASLSTGTGQTTLYHWSYDPVNDAWSSPGVVRATTASFIAAPSVRFDAAGNEVVLWNEREPSNGPAQIRSRRFIAGGMGWLADVAVSPLVTGEAHTNPALAVAPDGTAMALWYHNSNSGQSNVPLMSLLR